MSTIMKKLTALFMMLFALGLLSGCASTGDSVSSKDDPYEGFNRSMYKFNDVLDKGFLQPLASGYATIVPSPVRKSITNFFDNLGYLNVILNALLQGKFDQAVSDSLRFVYNSTLGIGGLFDVSTAIGAPRNNDDFGKTLASWGFERGSYWYYPFFGPDTTRNSGDVVTRNLVDPTNYLNSIVLFPLRALNIVNTRANLLDATRIRDEAAVDPYVFTREAFLQQRDYLIYDGNPPVDGYDDIFDDASVESEDTEGRLVIE